jgi:hypothetical protein
LKNERNTLPPEAHAGRGHVGGQRERVGLSETRAVPRDGITRLLLRGGAAGRPSITLSGAGALLPLPAPVNGTRFFQRRSGILIQLHRTDAPSCWNTSIAATATKLNAGHALQSGKLARRRSRRRNGRCAWRAVLPVPPP